MQLLFLDANFQPLGYPRFFNLQWNREYYKAGDFSAQIPASDYDAGAAYLYTPDRTEMGMIQKVELTETIKGRFVQLSGFFLEAILNDKVVYPTYYATGDIAAEVAAMINTYKDDIPLLTVDTDTPTSETAEWQNTGDGLADCAYAKLQAQQMSLRCVYEYEANTITCSVWQGADRTQEQTENSFVVFSDGFRNLAEVDATLDSSNYKNYAIVAGQDQNENRKIAYADLSDGEYKRVLFVDAKSEQWDTDKQTEAQYLESLQQYGLDKLQDYQKTQNVEVDVSSGKAFAYLTDFDLGDLVDVVIADIGVSMTARIVSVHEVFKQNNHTVTVELGDKKLSLLKKARLIY